MGKLRMGIIGIGGIGQVHAESLLSTGEAEIAAICDVDRERLEEQGKEFDVKECFSDYRKVLKVDLDAVLVCVHNDQHREIAIAALETGVDVFLEKPMAMNAAEAGEIVAAAEKAKGILQIGMVWRQDPSARVVREYVEKGLFGSIYHMRAVMTRRRGIPGLGGWFTTTAKSGGGPMIDLGVHWFDISMWMSGLWNPTAVSARTYAKFGPRMGDYKYVGMWAGPPRLDGVFDVEDYSTGFVRFDDEATMSFEICWAANTSSEAYVEILGDGGGVRLFEGKDLQIYTEHEDRLADIHPQLDMKVDRYALQAASFVSAVRRECPPAATAEQGLTVMKLIDAIYASSEQGKEVPV